jgi:hypothetical protein
LASAKQDKLESGAMVRIDSTVTACMSRAIARCCGMPCAS